MIIVYFVGSAFFNLDNQVTNKIQAMKKYALF